MSLLSVAWSLLPCGRHDPPANDMTVLGLLTLHLHVAGAMSLKDKRRSVKSFKDRVAHRFNVSIAEVDDLDLHRSAVLAVAMVGNDQAYVQGALQQVINLAGNDRDMVLMSEDIEWL